MALPEQDGILMFRNQIMARITGLMGGRVAEELFCTAPYPSAGEASSPLLGEGMFTSFSGSDRKYQPAITT